MAQKIGILTYHHVVNWGSILQAYCLQRFLEKLCPKDEVEIIDYVSQTSFDYSQKRLYPSLRKHFWQKQVLDKPYSKKYSICRKFLNLNCTLSKKQLCSDSIIDGQEFLEAQHYDLVFVGSDTVFQLGSNFGNKYIGAPQAPNLYFLPFPTTFNKVAFAVSVNPFNVSMLDSLDIERTREALDNFKVIFYRDEVTRQALEKLGISLPLIDFMPDPSLLVDFDLLLKPQRLWDEHHIWAAVAIGNAQLAAEISEILRCQGYTPVNLLSGARSDDAEKLRQVNSLEDYLALHRQFSLVITDRFHGSIISLVVGNCPIIGVEEVKRYPEPNSKVRDLYQRLNLENMVFRYDGQALDSAWLTSYLDKWEYTKYDIFSKVLKIRLESTQNLINFSNLLTS